MMSAPISASATLGIEVADAASAGAQPVADGTSGFASTLDALFGEAAATAPVTPPVTAPGVSVAAPDESPPATDDAADVEQGPVVVDPLLLLGIPVASQLAASAPPMDPLQWLRLTLDRPVVARSASAEVGSADAVLASDVAGVELSANALAGGSASEAPAAPALLTGTTGVDPLLAQAAANAATGAESPAKDLVSVEAPRTDGAQAMQAPEQTATPRHAQESATRALPPPVTVPMQSPDWSREFAARVSWMVERGEQLASIRLTPEQLGPVEVRLAIREGEASIWFGAAQADTRAAIEQALPRLREMLAASGLALADSGVFQGSPRDPRHGLVRSDARRAAGESAEPLQELQLHYRRLGLIDDYA